MKRFFCLLLIVSALSCGPTAKDWAADHEATVQLKTLVEQKLSSATQPAEVKELKALAAALDAKLAALDKTTSAKEVQDTVTSVGSKLPYIGDWAGLLGIAAAAGYSEWLRRKKNAAIADANAEVEKHRKALAETQSSLENVWPKAEWSSEDKLAFLSNLGTTTQELLKGLR